MKKYIKIIILIVIIIVALILLVPSKDVLKDGGTIDYKAKLYEVIKVHSIYSDDEKYGFQKGTIVKIFNKEIYNNVKFEEINSETEIL